MKTQIKNIGNSNYEVTKNGKTITVGKAYASYTKNNKHCTTTYWTMDGFMSFATRKECIDHYLG